MRAQVVPRGQVLDDKMGNIERPRWGEVSFYARDPLGNPLCFVDENTLPKGRKKSSRLATRDTVS